MTRRFFRRLGMCSLVVAFAGSTIMLTQVAAGFALLRLLESVVVQMLG